VVGGAQWEQGDFNGDGNVGFEDLVALAQNYGTTQGMSSPAFEADLAAAFASVPEPSAIGIVLVAGLLGMRRRMGGR